MLNMVDEQLFYAKSRLQQYLPKLDSWSSIYADEKLDKEAEDMRLKKIFRRK